MPSAAGEEGAGNPFGGAGEEEGAGNPFGSAGGDDPGAGADNSGAGAGNPFGDAVTKDADPIGDLMADSKDGSAGDAGADDAPADAADASAEPVEKEDEQPEETRVAVSSGGTIESANQSEQFWVPDAVAKQCGRCKKGFGFFLRKHHCRMCGQIFCNACSTGRELLPTEYAYGDAPQRVCDGCANLINANRAPLSPEEALRMRLQGGDKKVEENNQNARFFKMLGLEPTASLDDVKRAYKKLATKLHPDKAKAAGIHYDTTEQFNKVKMAYEKLSKLLGSGRRGQEIVKAKARNDGTVRAGQKLARDESGRAIHAEACGCCHRRFTMLRRRHTCRACGSVVCAACSPSKRAVPGFESPEKVCKVCAEDEGARARSPLADVVMLAGTASELKAHSYLRRLKFEVFVDTNENGFKTNLTFAPSDSGVTDVNLRNLRSFGVAEIRTQEDFEWLHGQLVFRLRPRHKIVPPLFPGRRSPQPREDQLASFSNVLLKNVLLHDDPIFQLFLTLRRSELKEMVEDPAMEKDVTAWKRNPALQPQVKAMMALEFRPEEWFRFKIEQRVCLRVSAQQSARKKRQELRAAQNQERLRGHAERAEAYQARGKGYEQRKNDRKVRMEARKDRIKREQDRKDQQRKTDRLVYITREEDGDENLREVAATEVKVQRAEYDIASKSHGKACADQKAQLDTLVSVQTEWALDKQEYPNKVHKWLLQNVRCKMPESKQGLPDLLRQLDQMRASIPESSAAEQKRLAELKEKYEAESDLVVDEKELLQQEETPINGEEQDWEEEDQQIQLEVDLIAAERANRKKKEDAVEADVGGQERSIASRKENQQKRLEAQAARKEEQASRADKHESLIVDEAKRIKEQNEWQSKLRQMLKVEGDKLNRQRTETYVLRFDHSQAETLLASVRQGLELHKKALSDCKETLRADGDAAKGEVWQAKQERSTAESDLERMREGKNRRTVHEQIDGKYDERDEFANAVHQRRVRNEEELSLERDRLTSERKRNDEEMSRLEREEKTLNRIKSDSGAEEVEVVKTYDLIDQLATVLREDETSRATKMKQYLEFVNQIVARQTARLMRYKDIKATQANRAQASAEKVSEGKSSMARLVQLDKESGTRMSRSGHRTDALQRQLGEQQRTEQRLFFDNTNNQSEYRKDVQQATQSENDAAQTNQFVASIRPMLNAGMKEKSDQVRLLQETWKASKEDHASLLEFSKKYPREVVSVSGIDTVQDHDAEFAHTLRQPYDLAFKQDESESKDYFHPISDALLKEGDTFSVLRSAQDDLSVWVQKVRDSLRDEAKARREESSSLQSADNLRIQKERKREEVYMKIENDVGASANNFGSIKKDLTRASDMVSDVKSIVAQNAELERALKGISEKETASERRAEELGALAESEGPGAERVEANRNDREFARSGAVQYTSEISAGKAKLEKIQEAKANLSEKLEEFSQQARDGLLDLKQRIENAKSEAGGEPAERDEWLKKYIEALGKQSQRVNELIERIPIVGNESSGVQDAVGAWIDAMEAQIKAQEGNLKACEALSEQLKKEESAISQKSDDYAEWQRDNQETLADLKDQLSVAESKVAEAYAQSEDARRLCSTEGMAEREKAGEKIVQLIEGNHRFAKPDYDELKEEGVEAIRQTSAESVSALDKLRMAYVAYSQRATKELKQGSANAEKTRGFITFAKQANEQKPVLKRLLGEFKEMPPCPVWDVDLKNMIKRTESSLAQFESIDPDALEKSLSEYKEKNEALEKILKNVSEAYESHKTEADAARKKLTELAEEVSNNAV